jgi:hypothetical protein
MHHNKIASGGSSHDRRKQRRHDEDGTTSHSGQVRDTANQTVHTPSLGKTLDPETTQRRNDLLALLGVSLGCASWGWTVLAPDSSVVFGSLLLFAAVGTFLFGLWRVWTVRRVWFVATALLAVIGFTAFDWFVVVRPQRGKPFRELLVEGYHLTNECQSIPANQEMPSWIRDQSKAWQSRVQQLVEEKLTAAEAQTWQSAMVIGTVNDEKLNGYQCLWLGNKVSALEKIVATNFQASLKHREQIAPTFWLDAVNGEVDMTPVLNSGVQGAGVYINGGGIGVKVKGNAPIKNGTVTFQLQPPP